MTFVIFYLLFFDQILNYSEIYRNFQNRIYKSENNDIQIIHISEFNAEYPDRAACV